MRITSGFLRGRTLRVPKAGVRPTQDRLRQSLFSSLGSVEGARVLDLFAGTGALGLEAWSRGAARVCWVERDARAYSILRENVRALCGASAGEAALCIRGDALRLEPLASALGEFDLVLADPPYDPEGGAGPLPILLEALARLRLVREGGYFVFERRAGGPAPIVAGWELLRDRAMGGSRWLLYRRLVSEPPSEGAGKREGIADREEQEHHDQ